MGRGKETSQGAGAGRNTAGLTLLEMMVAVTLLALIMVGLLSMFNQTQKALHIVNTQTDVFENARGAIQMIARDVAEMTATGDSNLSAYVIGVPNPTELSGLTLPSGSVLNPFFDEAFWLSRVNDEWEGIGYFVEGTNFGVGTLYRFSETVRRENVGYLPGRFAQSTNVHRVSDGIVHFQMQAVYVDATNPTNQLGQPIFSRAGSVQFLSNDLPAYVDLELGVLEPAVLKQFQAIMNEPAANPGKFLARHVGNVHFFRERVPIRNFINPHRAHEVP